jgi:hypothetical protein
LKPFKVLSSPRWISIKPGHTPSRRNNSLVGCPSGKYRSRCECLTKRDKNLPRSEKSLSRKGEGQTRKAGLGEMETEGDVFEGRLNKMDTMDLEAN